MVPHNAPDYLNVLTLAKSWRSFITENLLELAKRANKDSCKGVRAMPRRRVGHTRRAKPHRDEGMARKTRRRAPGRPRGRASGASGLCLRSLALVSAAALSLHVERSSAEVRSVSRVYHSACLERGQSYWDYENFQLSSVDWGEVDGYEVTDRLGFGRFSEVMEGVSLDDGHKVVLKVLKPARLYKIKREIRVLQLLSGGPNVLALEGVCRDRDTGTTTLVLEHLGEGAQWFGHTVSSASAAGGTPTGGATVGLPPASGAINAADASPRGVHHFSSPMGELRTSGDAGAAASSIGQGRVLSSTTTTPGPRRPSLADTGTPINRFHEREVAGLEPSLWRESQHSTDLEERQGAPGERVRVERGEGGEVNRGALLGEEGQRAADLESGRLSDYEVRLYLYKLLQALDFAHSRGLMHRDVKPRNVVINRRTRSLRLIDWGLGDFYIPGRRNMARVGSRYYKAPELLVGFRFYDYAVDIFSVGCMLAGFVLNREPFFRGKNNEDQLLRIALVLGTQGLFEFLRKYDVVLEPKLVEMLGTHRKKAWESVGGTGGRGTTGEIGCNPEGLDLLNRMLCYDHQDRISAGEALCHAFFDPVRAEADAATAPKKDAPGFCEDTIVSTVR